MAVFPCDIGRHRYPGPQQTMYPAVVDGDLCRRRKLRLCPIHFAELLDRLHQGYSNGQIEFLDVQAVTCPLCSNPVRDETGQFFATVYAKGSERADFWAPVHTACIEALADDWYLPSSFDC